MARVDRKLAKKVYKGINGLDGIKKSMIKDFKEGEEDPMEKDIEKFIENLEADAKKVEKIHEDGFIQIFDEMQEIKDIYNKFEKAGHSRDPQVEAELNEDKQRIIQLKNELLADVRKIRGETADLKYDRQYIAKYANVLGMLHTIQVVARLERHVRKERKKLEHAEKDVKDDANKLRHGKPVKQEDLQEHMRELRDEAHAMTKDIAEIEHSDVIIYFHLVSQLEYLKNVYAQLKVTRYDAEKYQHLEDEYRRIQNELEQTYDHLLHMANYLYERGERKS
ncbi:hypothetical protein K9M79_02160 [Candidatus Woesearchaeota archaeon]|nr:hypothetical protein [Candidatus Woesearchaeota archaeon]